MDKNQRPESGERPMCNNSRRSFVQPRDTKRIIPLLAVIAVAVGT